MSRVKAAVSLKRNPASPKIKRSPLAAEIKILKAVIAKRETIGAEIMVVEIIGAVKTDPTVKKPLRDLATLQMSLVTVSRASPVLAMTARVMTSPVAIDLARTDPALTNQEAKDHKATNLRVTKLRARDQLVKKAGGATIIVNAAVKRPRVEIRMVLLSLRESQEASPALIAKPRTKKIMRNSIAASLGVTVNLERQHQMVQSQIAQRHRSVTVSGPIKAAGNRPTAQGHKS